jgi:hypothetical protein
LRASRSGEKRGGGNRGHEADEREQAFHGDAIHGSTAVIKKKPAGAFSAHAGHSF